MARTLHQLTIFVSGPSTVEAEKAALRVIVEEVSRRSEKTHALTLRVVGWPDNIRPGVNADPQLEIGHQIGSDYDIYIGILGSRFGTPTAHSGSGTEQEFEEALARFQKDSTAVRLLFYFKRDAEDPFSLDLSQLQKVRDFRQSLGVRGVLYRDCRDTADFTKLVREHLDSLIIDEWREGKWLAVVAPLPAKQPDLSSDVIATSQRDAVLDSGLPESEDDDLGFLDYMAAFHDAAAAIVPVMDAITQETLRFADEITARAAETELIVEEFEKHKGVGGSRTQQQLVGQARATVDKAARNLDDFTTAMTPNVEQFKVHSRALFDNIRRAFQAGTELGPRDSSGDREQLASLIPISAQSREQAMTFQASISRVPALTGRFKRSRSRATAILGEMIAGMSFLIQEASTLLSEMGGSPGEPSSTSKSNLPEPDASRHIGEQRG